MKGSELQAAGYAFIAKPSYVAIARARQQDQRAMISAGATSEERWTAQGDHCGAGSRDGYREEPGGEASPSIVAP